MISVICASSFKGLSCLRSSSSISWFGLAHCSLALSMYFILADLAHLPSLRLCLSSHDLRNSQAWISPFQSYPLQSSLCLQLLSINHWFCLSPLLISSSKHRTLLRLRFLHPFSLVCRNAYGNPQSPISWSAYKDYPEFQATYQAIHVSSALGTRSEFSQAFPSTVQTEWLLMSLDRNDIHGRI